MTYNYKRLLTGFTLLVVSYLMVGCVSPVAGKEEVSVPRGLYAHNPRAASVNVQLGLAYLEQGEMQRAKRKLLLASKQDAASPVVQDALAYYYEKIGEPQQAEQHYLAAIALRPGSGDVHNNYGTFLCEQKRFEAARSEFMKAIEDKKYLHTAEAYENAGLCAIDNQRYQEARYFLEKALHNDPKLTKARSALAHMGDHEHNG